MKWISVDGKRMAFEKCIFILISNQPFKDQCEKTFISDGQ